ncbi:MAG TPA: phage holin family protein [Micromonosporaceae bacterium]|nr:phage holin family protein [Micromonosporaceae bacterium]
MAEVADDVSRLFRQEVELAKAEIKTEATKAGKAAGMLGGAGFAGYMLALFASLALMFGLDAVMPAGWAAVIVAALWGVVGAVLYSTGRKKLKDVSPVPQQTVETLKEDAQWLRNPTG